MTTPEPSWSQGEWTYSGNPTDSLRDEVRFLMQDTEPTMPLLSNAELDYLIAFWMPRYESAYYVASVACGVVSRKFAGVVSISADGVSVSVGDLSSRYDTLSTKLRAQHQEANFVGGAIDLANLMNDSELDPSIAALNFEVGGHDNPMAGSQEYGGRRYGKRGNYLEGGFGQP